MGASHRHMAPVPQPRSWTSVLGPSGRCRSKATAELVEAHRLWCNWLESGRIRKFAMVAEKRGN